MFIRKSLVLNKATQNILKSSFSGKNSRLVESSVRTRNFFDVDPLFPDGKDDETKLYRDFERTKIGTNKTQERKIFERHTTHMVKRIKQSIEREEKIKKLQGNRGRKQTEQIQAITENIFLDEETKLPYGIGLDEYIELIKEESITTKTGQFYSTLETICRKIGAFNDVELIKLYQFILAEKVAESFKNEARQFLLKRIIQEVQKLGWNSSDAKTKLKSYLDSSKATNEFVESALKEGDSENFAQTITPLFKDEAVTEEAKKLAVLNIQDKIRFNTNLKREKEPPKKIDQGDPFFSEESDIESNFAEPLFNFDDLKPSAKDFVNIHDTQGRKLMEDQQIWAKVKKNYYENKRKYYREKMYTEEDKSKEVVTKDININLVEFLINSKDEQEIKNLIYKYNLVEEVIPRPDFKEVLNNIDYLVDQASTSIKVQIAKEKNQNKNLYFRGNFLSENLKPEDLMWKHFETTFLSVFPENIAEQEQVNSMAHNENDIRFDIKELDIIEYGTGGSKDLEQRKHNERDLDIDSQVEVELYRRQKQDPFFRHYIQHEMQYFAERIQDGILDIAQGFAPADRKFDTPSYYDPTMEDIPNDLIDDEELRLKYQKLKQEKDEGIKVFSSGKRKTSTCLVVIKEGTGKVFVNNEIFYRYFTHPFNRNIALKPMFLSSQYCEYDIHFHVRGGGVMAQSHSCQIALARGLIQLHPNLRPIFMKLDLLRTDYRQKERKKTGRYKARKAHTYVRR